MVNDWDRRFPGRLESMFRSQQNVVPSHLADTAFDKEEFRDPPPPRDDEAEAAPKKRTISILDSRNPAGEGSGCGA